LDIQKGGDREQASNCSSSLSQILGS